MTGLYIHIPFCRSRCVYCGFYSTTDLGLRQRYVDALCRELALRGRLSDPGADTVATVYLGGGTPSQLTAAQLHQLFDAIYKYNKVEDRPEITIECNPDDVTPSLAESLARLPVNRVSMGIQTFDDRRLRFLRRRHTGRQAETAVGLLRQAGIQNVSIDLMYGLPGETLSDWEADISRALRLEADHLSAYSLMIEEGTPLYGAMKGSGEWTVDSGQLTVDSYDYQSSADLKGVQGNHNCQLSTLNSKLSTSLPDEETELKMFDLLIDRLTAAGYEHYEISNFSRPGCRSRHNSSYWTGTPYIGIGAAAHSYDIRSRSWNVADVRRYIEGMQRGERIFDEELIDDDTRYNDTVTVALRTCEGIDLSALSDRHRSYCMKNARRFIRDGLLELCDGRADSAAAHLRLTRRGLFVSDMVMSELMLV